MPDLNDTIVAPATVPGESAVAIVRLSGPRATDVVDGFASLRSGASVGTLKPRRLVSCVLRNGDEIFDHSLCVRFAAPASFTGEDMIELHVHGNPVIVDLTLRAAVDRGARLASAGEFSRRAFVNGKMDLTQVEGLGAVIRAESERAVYLSQRQLHGELSSAFADVRASLVRLLGLLELELDFADDGYLFVDREGVRELVRSLSSLVDRLLVSYGSGDRLRRGPRILLIGLPNAGKSSLFNALVGFARTLVSPVAGTTRDYIEERVSHSGVVCHLIDTAGLRETVDTTEAAGVRLSEHLIGVADHVLFLIDSSTPDSESVLLCSQLEARHAGTRFHRVYTKSDIGSPPSGHLACSVFDPGSVRSVLDSVVSGYTSELSSSLLLLTRRQFDLLQSLSRHLLDADWGAQDSELLAYDLRSVLLPLDELSGAVTSNDVLNGIFDSFCIGK
jgi:tRNA modification GTPase